MSTENSPTARRKKRSSFISAVASETKSDSARTRLTVYVDPDQILWLDELELNIKRQTGAKIKRSAIVREMLDLFRDRQLDLSAVYSEEDFKLVLKENLTDRQT